MNNLLQKKFCSLLIFLFLISIAPNTFAIDSANEPSLQIVYFYSTTCSTCQDVTEYLSSLSPEECALQKYNIYIEENIDLLYDYCLFYDISNDEVGQVPIIFVGNYYYMGEDIVENLKELVGKKQIIVTPDITEVKTNIIREQKVDLAKLIIASIVNGLNPCSLSMFLFLIMLLANNQSSKIISVGILYCIGKVVMFCLIGSVLFQTFAAINNNKLLSLIYYGMIILYIVLGSLNLRDFFVLRNHKKANMMAQLPKSFRKFNHKIIRYFSKIQAEFVLPILSLLLGALIASTEFLCSGQIFLLTIVEMIQKNTTPQYISYFYLFWLSL